MGTVVVSMLVLPRYKIGDLIRASPTLSAGARVEPPYFRCIGREKWWTPLRYAWNKFKTFNLGRL